MESPAAFQKAAFEKIVESVRRQCGSAVLGSLPEALDPSIEIAPGRLRKVCQTLRDDPELRFDLLHCITAVDYFTPEGEKPTFEGEPRVEVLYHLSSMTHRHQVVLRVKLPRWADDEPGQLPELKSVADLWPTADWHEREVFDLMGVRFAGHPQLERILCPEDWIGHPLRKDYVPPVEYQGIRVK